MKMIIHDLDPQQFAALVEDNTPDVTVISDMVLSVIVSAASGAGSGRLESVF
ncbi:MULTISPECIES: hypothetical protein [Paenibacillus]|uniref:hypothetical protein n=1 Tax=Paenibacillus TaxID=44249 RepID=UPI002115E636|nr:hypothetical protein [Paenibacillus borealis]